MNSDKITKEFNAGHVGQLTQRHEQLAQSRAEQQAIPYAGKSYADERNERNNQQSNGGTQ